MKQAQSEKARYGSFSALPVREEVARGSRRRVDRLSETDAHYAPVRGSWFWAEAFWSVLTTVWYVITAPFRLAFWLIAWVGRVTAALFGFCLMVVGIALGAGPLFFLGIPLFLVGLVLTLKCLD